jgi:hypothetical protein
MKRLTCMLVALGGLAFAAPAMADHDYDDYYPPHRYSVHCNCYRCVAYRGGFLYEGYRRGYHPRSVFQPYPRYYGPYYGRPHRRLRRGYYPRRGFGYYGPGFSISIRR